MLQNHCTYQQSNHCSKTVPRKRLLVQGGSPCTGRVWLHRESHCTGSVPVQRDHPFAGRVSLYCAQGDSPCTLQGDIAFTGRASVWQWQWHCHCVNGSGSSTATVLVPVSLWEWHRQCANGMQGHCLCLSDGVSLPCVHLVYCRLLLLPLAWSHLRARLALAV